jgi:hypothetical protein
VNGAEVARGPVRSNPRRLHYDLIDLAPFLGKGENVIAVLARHFGSPNPWWAPAPLGSPLGAGALVFEAYLGEDYWLISDAAWRAHDSDAWQELPHSASGIGGMAPDSHDARRLAPHWIEVDFDDTSWDPATELAAHSVGFSGRHEPPSHPYGPLLPRPIPQLGITRREGRIVRIGTAPRGDDRDNPFDQVLADSERASTANAGAAFPARLEASPEGVRIVSVDFGQVVCGTVILDLEAPAGARFDAAATEFANAEGAPAPDGERNGFRYIARGVQDRFETFNPIGFRYLHLSLRAEGPIVIRDVAVNERLYPREAGPFFECSDETLNRIWAVGRRTVDLNSHDAYLDCPTREQRAWTGDSVVHQLVDLASNSDWRLACWSVELAASPRPDGMLPMAAGGDLECGDFAYIPDWALHWIHALHNLYRYTGDRELVRRLLPVAEGVLHWFVPFQTEDGLLTDVTGWILIDWSSVTTEGKSSVLNALWARGLADFAEMAGWMGDAGRLEWARATHRSITRSFDAFWDPERRLYVDHISKGERGRPVSQHAQAAPLVARLVRPERIERLVEVMIDEKRLVHATWSVASGDARNPKPGESGVGGVYLFAGPPCPWWDVESQIVRAQPFFRYVVHDALAAAGREDLIASQCLDWKELFKRSESSWSETWFGGTVSHGWSSTPTRDLLTRTLGVAPAEPGFGTARIAPRLGSLDWARGAVPTPEGLLSVDVSGQRIEIESPIPFELDLGDGKTVRHRAGRHTSQR